jgi:hypothetical protein
MGDNASCVSPRVVDAAPGTPVIYGCRARTGNPIGRPREPKPDKAPRSIAQTKAAKRSPDLGDLAVAIMSRLAAVRAAERAASTRAASPSVPPVARVVERAATPVKLRATPPQIPRTIPKGQPAYRLILDGCQCPFVWPTPHIPETVTCPRHGRQRVESCAAADSWPGPRLVIPQRATHLRKAEPSND